MARPAILMMLLTVILGMVVWAARVSLVGEINKSRAGAQQLVLKLSAGHNSGAHITVQVLGFMGLVASRGVVWARLAERGFCKEAQRTKDGVAVTVPKQFCSLAQNPRD